MFTKRQILVLILTIVLALTIRFLLSPAEGGVPDMNYWRRWSQAMVQNGFTTVYEQTEANYPPLFLYTLGSIGHFYQNFISSLKESREIFNTLLKTPAILFDILTGFIIFFVLKKLSSFKFAYLAMLFYIFNPGIIYESSWWGQVDALNTLLIVLSFLCLIAQKKTSWSWIFLTLAIFTKLQSVIFLPLILFIVWKKDHRLKQIAIVLFTVMITTLIILSPFIFTYRTDSFLNNMMSGSVGFFPFLSIKAFNVWWPSEIIKGQLIQDTNLIFGPINYRHLGLAMFACAYIFVLYFLNKKSDSKSIWLAGSFVALAFFMLPTEMHERYLFPIFALLSMIWIQDKKLWPIYGILSCTFFLNLIYALPLPFMSEASKLELRNASVVICLINLGVFVYFVRLLVLRLKKAKNLNNETIGQYNN